MFSVFFEKITNIPQISQAIYVYIIVIINCDAFALIILSWLYGITSKIRLTRSTFFAIFLFLRKKREKSKQNPIIFEIVS